MQTIDKLRKFAEGGKVRKYGMGNYLTKEEAQDLYTQISEYRLSDQIELDDNETAAFTEFSKAKEARKGSRKLLRAARQMGDSERVANMKTAIENETKTIRDNRFEGGLKGQIKEGLENFEDNMSTPEAKLGIEAGMKALNVFDDAVMGDKNFGAQSQAIDGAVDMAADALMKSGNPYAIAAAGALKTANFLTKAGGQTVQGFDVDIASSGYGDIGHMESSSSRDFGAMIGLGGLNQGKMQAKLAKRNQQAMMAMNAANIANEQSFEQEARMNSVQNTIMNNQIALAGGVDTSLLGG